MNTDKLKPQSTPTRCSIAVIRAILYDCTKKDYSEKNILRDFPARHDANGTDVTSITEFWSKQDNYQHEKKDEQTNEDIERETQNNHKYAMIIINTPKPNTFHCVLFNGIEGDKIRYWDPDPDCGDQLVSKDNFDRMRKHDDRKRKFREVHYISPRAG